MNVAGLTSGVSGTVALAGQRVVVTGAAGFIGSHVVERLAVEGALTRALVRARPPSAWQVATQRQFADTVVFVPADIVRSDLKAAFADANIVLHLAAHSVATHDADGSRASLDTNVVGTLNVLAAAAAMGVSRFVYASSGLVYGKPRSVPVNEEHILDGRSPYAASKIAAENLVRYYSDFLGLPATIVRPFNVYGPRQGIGAVLPTIISQALQGGLVTVRSLVPIRDFLFVDDAVSAIISAATHPASVGCCFNIGYGKGVSIATLATAVLETVRAGSGGRLTPTIGEVLNPEIPADEVVCDATLAERTFGWRPQVPLDIGVERTVRSYAAWIQNTLPAPLLS